MPDAPACDAALAQRIIELARGGFSRAQVASALGISIQRLVAMAADPDIAEALVRADTEERAYWDAQPLEAIWATNRTFHPSAWEKAMVQRFGSAAHRNAPRAKETQPARPQARLDLPHKAGTARRPKAAADEGRA